MKLYQLIKKINIIILYLIIFILLLFLNSCSTPTDEGGEEKKSVRFSDPRIITNTPSQIQFVFGLKESKDKTYPIEISDLEGNIKIYEDDKEISYEETSVFIRSAESFELEIVLVLDFTKSMSDTAGAIDQMKQSAIDLINQLNASHRVAIIEYHDRNSEPAVLQDFTSDKQTLVSTIENIAELDNGSSRCWDAVELGMSIFSTRSSDDDVRALVFLSDGDDTSSSATPEDIIDLAKGKGITIYPIAFGLEEEDVEAKETLEKIAQKTEGVFYEATDSEAIKEQFTNIVGDLGGKYKISYISLKREGVVEVEFHVYIEEKDITLKEKAMIDMSNIYGPDNVGRLTQDTSKVVDGKADIFIRSEHTPRNVKKIRFKIGDPTLQYEIVLPTKDQGGLLEGWSIVEQDADGFYTIQTEGEAILFADFGLFINIKLSGLAEGSFVRIPFEIDNTIYQDQKKFTYDPYLIAGRNIENMVQIEAGNFVMGSSSGHTDELPKHETYLSAFYMDTTEVSYSEYAEFLNNVKTIESPDGDLYINLNPAYSAIVYDQVIDVYRVREGWENFPVIGVTWYGANAYAKWNGKRLPTEAEWEYAASNGGLTIWSLSDEFNPNDYTCWENKGGRYDNTRIGTAPINKVWDSPSGNWIDAKKNEFGLYHMSGNVWEWVNDWYGTYSEFISYDPQGVAFGSGKVLRGGAWSMIKDQLRTRFRGYREADFGSELTGFRCATDGN